MHEHRKQGIFVLIAVVVLLIYAFTHQAPPQTASTRPDLELLGTQANTDSAFNITFGKIEGMIRNNSDHPYRSVLVEINLYDAAGNQVGSTNALGSNIEPGSTWKFSAQVWKADAVRYKIVNIRGY